MDRISQAVSRPEISPSRRRGELVRRTLWTCRALALVGLFAQFALSPQVAAAPKRGNGEIVVSTPGARAVIRREPFGMRFEDGSGKVVLRSVDVQPAPEVIPPTTDPLPEAGMTSGVTQYAPLFFEVGFQQLVTWKAPSPEEATFWVGNMLYGYRQGAIFSAQSVIDVKRVGQGVELHVATNDPEGRELLVTVRPDGARAIRVVAMLSNPAGVMNIGDSFVSGPDEAFHGFGGRHTSLDHRGRRFYSWTEQENLGGGLIEYEAAQEIGPELAKEYMYPNGPLAAYYPQNLFMSSRDYGMLVAREEFTRWRLASDRPDAWQMKVAAPVLDYTVVAGNHYQVVHRLGQLNGQHRLPPEWAQTVTLSRTVQIPDPQSGEGGDTAETYAAKVQDDLAQIEALDLPVGAYVFEGWASLDPAFVQSTIATLKKRGIEPILYIRLYLSGDRLLTQPAGQLEEAIALGITTRKASGEPYIWYAPYPSVLLDLTNPAAIEWYRGRLEAMLDLGADGFMLDFGEQVTDDMFFANGEIGLTMHNRYPILWTKITRELTDTYKADNPGRGPIFFFNRAGFSGREGSAAYESSNFPGDETTDWSVSSGIGAVIPDMLNRAIGGAYGFNTDIGGYADFVNTPTSKELFIRWAQLAALTPFFRVHNSALAGVRMPWSFDDEALELFRAAAELHLEALPTIRELWKSARLSGQPVTRPLWLDYPGERGAVDAEQQWLLGPTVLVAPVVTEGARSREVYFPTGCWRDAYTGETYEGPVTETVDAPLDQLPYFFRCDFQGFPSSQH